MAEFQEVAKELERMCNTYLTARKCKTDVCPLYCGDLCYAQAIAHVRGDDACNLEKVVMDWAKANPAPIYPTWFEVLERFGIAGRINGEPYYDSTNREVYLKQPAFTPKAFESIPADIAQKLGIEPKEGI